MAVVLKSLNHFLSAFLRSISAIKSSCFHSINIQLMTGSSELYIASVAHDTFRPGRVVGVGTAASPDV